MARLLILVAIVGLLAWWLFGRSGRGALGRGERSGANREGSTQEMVACAHCGVHLPRADASLEGEQVYCGDEHRRLGPRRHD